MQDFNIFFIALCDVFDKADITRDGTISIAEYMALCEEYGVELSEEDIKAVEEIADTDGEVDFLSFLVLIESKTFLHQLTLLT